MLILLVAAGGCERRSEKAGIAGVAGRRVPLATVASGRYDDQDQRVEYKGKWWPDHQFPQSSGQSITYSDKPGDTFRIAFTGSAITYVFTQALNRGIAEVRIDGGAAVRINQYSGPTKWQEKQRFGGLSPGATRWKSAYRGTKIPRRAGCSSTWMHSKSSREVARSVAAQSGSKILSMRYLYSYLALATLAASADDYTGPRPPKPDVLYLVHASNLIPTEVTEAQQEGKKDDTHVFGRGRGVVRPDASGRADLSAAQRKDQAGCAGVVPVRSEERTPPAHPVAQAVGQVGTVSSLYHQAG